MTKAQIREAFEKVLDKYKEATDKTDAPVFHVARWWSEGMFMECSFRDATEFNGTVDEAAEFLCKKGFKYSEALSLLCFAMESVLREDCENWCDMELSGFTPKDSEDIFAATVDDIKFEPPYDGGNMFTFRYNDIADSDIFSRKSDFEFWYEDIDLV